MKITIDIPEWMIYDSQVKFLSETADQHNEKLTELPEGYARSDYIVRHTARGCVVDNASQLLRRLSDALEDYLYPTDLLPMKEVLDKAKEQGLVKSESRKSRLSRLRGLRRNRRGH